MGSYGIFKDETEWLEWVEEIDAVVEAHGTRLADKLAREIEHRFFDDRTARFAIYDLRTSAIMSDREAYKTSLNSAIREATKDVILRTKLFTVEYAA